MKVNLTPQSLEVKHIQQNMVESILYTPGNMMKHGWFVLRPKWNSKGMPGLENSRQWKGNKNKSAITGTHLVMFHTFLDTILWGFASLCINTAHLPASPHYHQTMDPCGPIWTNTSHRKTCDIPHLTKYSHWPNILCFGSDREAYLRQINRLEKWLKQVALPWITIEIHLGYCKTTSSTTLSINKKTFHIFWFISVNLSLCPGVSCFTSCCTTLCFPTKTRRVVPNPYFCLPVACRTLQVCFLCRICSAPFAWTQGHLGRSHKNAALKRDHF